MADEPDVKVPPEDYRASPEMEAIYKAVAKLLNTTLGILIQTGLDDPKVGRDMAFSMAFSAMIREALRHYDVETVVAMLRGYADSTPEVAALNARARIQH